MGTQRLLTIHRAAVEFDNVSPQGRDFIACLGAPVIFAGRATKSENPSANDIVAASSFGLWTSCLHKDRAQTLWRHHLAAGFHPTLKRGALFDQAYKLKKLRDRIAHHEPIFAERHETHLKEMRFVLSAIHEELPPLVEDCFPSLRRAIDGKEAALQHGVVDL